MKIKKNFILREVAGTFLVVAVGEAVKNFNAVINLNETGALLWKALEKGATEDELTNLITSEYDIDMQTARKDVGSFIQRLKEANLLD